jgi:hypothetical protein
MNNAEFTARWQELEDSKKPLIKQKEAIQTKLEKLTYDQDRLKIEYLENNAFSVGTKVTLQRSYPNKNNGEHYLIFESRVTGLMSNPSISYGLTKPKKDGSLPLKQLQGVDYVSQSDLKEGWV